MKSLIIAIAGVTSLSGAAFAAGESATFPYADVLNLENRTDEDRIRDPMRKPVEVLEFTGIQPGDTVLEMEAGNGYFTTMIAHVVGEEGHVYLQAPANFTQFWNTDTHPRMANNSLPDQVELLIADFYDMSAVPSGSVDVVTWMLGPHELWFTPDDRPEGFGDPDETFAEIFRVMRSGGSLILLDHEAPEGAPATTGGDTHRIASALVDGFAETAGFVEVARSDLFANPDDDRTLNVFTPEIRGRTDQFLIRYEKP